MWQTFRYNRVRGWVGVGGGITTREHVEYREAFGEVRYFILREPEVRYFILREPEVRYFIHQEPMLPHNFGMQHQLYH